MQSILRSIEQDTERVIKLLNITLEEVRTRRGTSNITDKKVALYCYLRQECGYSWHEIGNYTYKCHSTVLKTVNKHKDNYQTYRHKLINRITQHLD